VEVTQYGERSIPKEVKGKCEVDNSIIMIVYGLYREVDDSSNKDVARLGSSFRDLRLSPELFKGSIVYGVAKAILSQEVRFIEDEGSIAYRDVDAIVTSLRRDDRVISVDLERVKRGERTGLVCGFLAGGLIGSIG
jgi:predicted subunit of tRNA(5-methylaminomethyl-2-thiouridylate) methyltransferase